MDLASLRRDIESHVDSMVDIRRAIHRNPEVGLHLPQTQATIVDALQGLGLEISLGKDLSSVTAVLRGGKKGPAVLLRAEMDALPLTEETGLSFASETSGLMHACGHDLHVAMLITAAKVLAARSNDLAGDIVFMFQPGEEGAFGARFMIDEGVLEASGEMVSAAYGLHVKSSGGSLGVFTTRENSLMASADSATITVIGRGGHGASPHHAIDPIPVAAEIVLALQTMITRKFDAFDPVIVTVGVFDAGTKNNIIPDTARLEATIRSFSAASRERIKAQLIQLVEHTSLAHGARAEIDFKAGYPVTINNPEHTRRVAATIAETFGSDRFVTMESPAGAADDVAYVLEKVPGCFVILGAEPANSELGADNHSPRAVFDESVLADGALLHVVMALQALGDSQAATTE